METNFIHTRSFYKNRDLALRIRIIYIGVEFHSGTESEQEFEDGGANQKSFALPTDVLIRTGYYQKKTVVPGVLTKN